MDKDKLTQEELLEELANMSLYRNISLMTRGKQKEAIKSAQAYKQLKEIVEWAYARGIPQQKKTVTKAWVNVQAADLMGAINDLAGKVGVLQVLREALPLILEDANVEVE